MCAALEERHAMPEQRVSVTDVIVNVEPRDDGSIQRSARRVVATP